MHVQTQGGTRKKEQNRGRCVRKKKKRPFAQNSLTTKKGAGGFKRKLSGMIGFPAKKGGPPQSKAKATSKARAAGDKKKTAVRPRQGYWSIIEGKSENN